MACTERLFFGLPIVMEAPPDLAETWGRSREAPGILVFAGRRCLWRLVRWRAFRRSLAGKAVAVVPVGGAARRHVRVATGCDVGEYSSFQAPIRILSRAELDSAGVFIIDTSPAAVRRVEENVKVTFPGLRIVGRAVFYREIAPSVTTAIRKSDPRIILVGSVRPAVIRWILSQHDVVGSSLTLIAEDAMSRMAERGRRVSPLELLGLPLRLLVLPVLLVHRLVRRHHQKKSTS